MKRMKKHLVLLLVLAMGISILPMDANAAKKAKLNKTKITMQVGKTVQLKVKNNKKKVKWSSSNKKIATVSKNGKVKAVNSGNAKITAKIAKKKLVCKVKVQKGVNNKDNDANGGTSQNNAGKDNSNVTPTQQPTITPAMTATAAPTVTPTATPATTATEAPAVTATATPATTATETPAVTATATPATTATEAPAVIPTATPVTEPTTPPSSSPILDSITENYMTLKTYIQSNGYTLESSGNKYIANLRDEFLYSIEYDDTKEAFIFSTYSELSLSNGAECQTLLNVEIKESDLRNGDLEFITLFSNGPSAVLTLTDSLEKLDFDSPLEWEIVDHNGSDEDTWKKQADLYGDLSYSGWNLLLKDTLEMNLSDLGFGVAI